MSQPAFPWRVGAALLTLALVWHPLRQILFVGGPHAVRRIEWSGDGLWYITRGTGPPTRAELHPATTMLGPLVVLIWLEAGRRRWALVDAASAEPRLYRTVRCRLRIEGFRALGRESADNW